MLQDLSFLLNIISTLQSEYKKKVTTMHQLDRDLYKYVNSCVQTFANQDDEHMIYTSNYKTLKN